MQLIVDGKKALLKKGSSFEYVSENRSFSDADDYTLSITLPLADCPENLEIFGHVDRMDVESRHIVLEAAIIDRGFSKRGIITVVEATPSDIKCQFLEGRSVQNFMTTLDNVYINELNLGSYPSDTLPATPATYLSDIEHGANQVALPWVYDDTGDIQNEMECDENGNILWAQFTKDTGKLSFQPYLIYIAKKICNAVGYTFDFTPWENSPEVNLIICNTLPAAWDIPQYARALPHWSVSEFFSELEKILVCEIDIDHKEKHIGMTFCNNADDVVSEVALQNVVDSFTSEVSYQDQLCQYKGGANIRYADRSDSKWQMDQCQWLVDQFKQDGKYYTELQTRQDLNLWQFSVADGNVFTEKDIERGPEVGSIVHVIEDDSFWLLRVEHVYVYEKPPLGWGWIRKDKYIYVLEQINRFGDLILDPDSGNDIEISSLPARLDHTDAAHGRCLFLAPSGYSESEDLDDDDIRQPVAYSAFLKGESSSEPEYYDKLFLAYWDGHSSNDNAHSEISTLPPAPYVDERFSLKHRYENYLSGIKVNPLEKLKVSWLGDTIPDVKAVFYFRSKRYLCEKITATFTENGMSQLLKGEFYPIED